MIIDLHTHIWTSLDQLGGEIASRIRESQLTNGDSFEASIVAHDRAMTCVDGSVIWGFRSDLLQANVPNELIADFVAKAPKYRIGIAGIDPLADDANDQLDAAIDLGLVGITVSPACQGFHPAHSSAMRIYERCQALSLPIFVAMLHPLTPSAMLEFGRPMLWDEVARSYPQLPIVLSHLGYPWVDEALLLLSKHDNMFADTSGLTRQPLQLYNALLDAMSLGVIPKLMFGSGFPYDTPAKAIETMYRINSHTLGTQSPTIPRSQLRAIVERDSLACLGIESIIHERNTAPEPTAPEVVVVDQTPEEITATTLNPE